MANKIDPVIKDIIEKDIFEYLELASMPEERKAQMMENLLISLRSRIMLRIADIIEGKDKIEFENFKRLLDNSDSTQEQIEAVLSKFNINLEQLTAEEAILLKAEVMGLKKKA